MNQIDTKLAAIMERSEAATEGPWETSSEDVMGEDYGQPICVRNKDFNIAYHSGPQVFLGKHDASFIAHARTDIPALVKALRRAVSIIRVVSQGSNINPKAWMTDIASILSETEPKEPK